MEKKLVFLSQCTKIYLWVFSTMYIFLAVLGAYGFLMKDNYGELCKDEVRLDLEMSYTFKIDDKYGCVVDWIYLAREYVLILLIIFCIFILPAILIKKFLNRKISQKI